MLVKLSPFVTMFLKAASHMFEMKINTKGMFGLAKNRLVLVQIYFTLLYFTPPPSPLNPNGP